MKPKKKTAHRVLKQRRKFSSRFKILATLTAMIVAVMVCIISPGFTKKRTVAVDSVTQNSIGDTSSMNLRTAKYNPKNHLYMEQLVIQSGASSTDDETDLTADAAKDLDNIKWDVQVAIQHGDNSKIKYSIHETQKRMLTIYVKNVPEDYTAIRFDLRARKQNKLLASTVVQGKSTSFRYYTRQNKTHLDKRLGISSSQQLSNDYITWQVAKYKKVLEGYEREDRAVRADIEQNTKLIAKLQAELVNQTKSEQQDTQDQIDEYTQTTKSDQQTLQTNKSHIDDMVNRIAKLKQQLY